MIEGLLLLVPVIGSDLFGCYSEIDIDQIDCFEQIDEGQVSDLS